jgi:hypothetical protein
MLFEEVIPALRQGKMARRKSWPLHPSWLQDGSAAVLAISLDKKSVFGCGSRFFWTGGRSVSLDSESILSDDWEVLTDEQADPLLPCLQNQDLVREEKGGHKKFA